MAKSLKCYPKEVGVVDMFLKKKKCAGFVILSF
jgi:hypothetical protein